MPVAATTVATARPYRPTTPWLPSAGFARRTRLLNSNAMVSPGAANQHLSFDSCNFHASLTEVTCPMAICPPNYSVVCQYRPLLWRVGAVRPYGCFHEVPSHAD